ncbi:hypothetical protein EJA70_03820 [Pseudomonas sp. PB103]|jgi:hypothetical protein|uniref:hypothetical protein n=1 Tax=Pseudomonas sp. PB103 TaxID=2494698 RepID=UPI00131B386C|nr:hypothetical protein [Pseudomonas sp. PB103]KAE9647818.1 hypothetical protein EJA70_03820 [Pseudomonas sp. PB103]
MKSRYPLTALLIAAGLFGCATSSNPGVNVTLTATRQNVGQIGNVSLADWGKDTGFSFFISGAPSGASLPLRLYAFVNQGSCAQPGPVAYAMNDKVSTERQPVRGWAFSRSAPVALSTLLAAEHSVVVRTAATDGSVDIFCGDIRQANVK